jgi:amino acid adenylation domain-containing protein
MTSSEVQDARTQSLERTARTLGEDLAAAAALDPHKEAVVGDERRLSYGELDAAATRIAAGLRAAGVRRGDRVALSFPNSLDAVVAIYGVLRAGAAFSPLNPTIKHDKLTYIIDDLDPAAVVCDEEREPDCRAAAANARRHPPVATLSDLGDRDGPPPATPIAVDLAAVIYTSGSTGRPKGVTLTHANMTFAADSIIEYVGMEVDDRVLCVMPLSFDYGLYQLLMCVRVGATLVLEPGFALAGRLVQLLEQERITGLPGVPTVFHILVGLHGLAERELPDLRFLTNTGAALPVEMIKAIRRTFPGARLISMYGLTECKRVLYLPPEQLDIRPSSVGIPIPGTEVWVEDANGNVADPGEVGELFVRGAHVMQGYWGDPELTSQRLRPGRWPWERVLATGDLFRRDEEGYLYFVGRDDDLIKSRGEKVVPREVEAVLEAAPGVAEAAVVGDAHRLLGQAVHAHVAPHPGHELDDAELRRHCAERLEDHMVPHRVTIHDALPRTAHGKIDRRALATGI